MARKDISASILRLIDDNGNEFNFSRIGTELRPVYVQNSITLSTARYLSVFGDIDEWQGIVILIDPGNPQFIQLYINGIQKTPLSHSNTAGGYFTTDFHFTMESSDTISNFSIYKYILNESEIQRLYDSEL